MKELAITAADAFNLHLTAEQIEQFSRYESLLLSWNERMNLTTVRQPASIRQRHFLDSLSCATVTGDLNGRSLIDVGTGAGFPGLPLKILFPQLRLTLVESRRKKTHFLEAVVADLSLSRVQILPERAESLAHQPAHREVYDWAVARAVAELRVLLEYLLPFCRIGGHTLAQKGEHGLVEVDEAASAIAALGGGEPKCSQIQLPNQTRSRFLIVITKMASTQAAYPRRPGIPGKRPL